MADPENTIIDRGDGFSQEDGCTGPQALRVQWCHCKVWASQTMADQELQEGRLWCHTTRKVTELIILINAHPPQYTQAEPPSNKNLASLVCAMQQFQEVSWYRTLEVDQWVAKIEQFQYSFDVSIIVMFYRWNIN